MLEYTEYEVKSEGKREIRLILPCFAGELTKNCREFYNAARMNRFYSAAADRMYEYAQSLSDEDMRRMMFLCCTCVEMEGDSVTVTLNLSLRRVYYHGSCPTARKTIVHHWTDGILQRVKKK